MDGAARCRLRLGLMNSSQIVLMGLAGGFAAGAMTAVGSVPVLFRWSMSQRAHDAFLGFAAGVMLAASFFSLIIPGLDVAEELTGSVVASAIIVIAGLTFGLVVMMFLDVTLG